MGVCQPTRIIFGTTIETNRENDLCQAPPRLNRVVQMEFLSDRKFVTIEPICDFDLDELVGMIRKIQPEWVNIGADSKGHNLPEPTRAKIDMLIKELKTFTEVKEKRNLERIK